MADTATKPWHVFQCAGPARHRIALRQNKIPEKCQRCGSRMSLNHSLDQRTGESDKEHMVRSLVFQKRAVH